MWRTLRVQSRENDDLMLFRVVIEVSDQLGRDLEHIFGRAICSAEQAKAYKKHTNAYKSIQMHTNAYKTVSSDQLDQDRANPALSQPWILYAPARGSATCSSSYRRLSLA